MSLINANFEHTACYIYGRRQGIISLLGLGFLMFAMTAGRRQSPRVFVIYARVKFPALGPERYFLCSKLTGGKTAFYACKS